ncbi:MAG: hypothetical protein RQ875_02095 [Vicingaceae bacterium]|nr:hypothetical protein [Vicingaceae bacterium]
MIRKITIFAVLFLCVIAQKSFAQSESGGNGLKYIPSIGANFGTLSYMGNLKGSEGSSVFTYWRPVYGVYLEKKIGSYLGITANGMFGKVSKSQLDNTVFHNFETSVTNIDLNLLLDFDNGKIVNENSVFSPFISIGFGYLMFDPKGDLFDKNGNFYHHWSDGTLRDTPENLPGADTSSVLLTRDYKYESALKDSTNDYAKTAFTIPLRFGLKFKLSPHLHARATVAYILTTTEYLDNLGGSGNDKLFQTTFGLQYNFAGSSSTDDKYKDFDFSSLDKEDSDGDGVLDYDDKCPNTKKGVAVDKNGCPLDSDKDGVPDYLDKEPNTPPGTLVNKEGITLTDEMIAEEHAMKDSVITEYKTFKAEDLSDEEMKEIQALYEQNKGGQIGQTNMPAKFVPLDTDKDKYLSAKEITNAIDQFFEGENNLTAKDLNELIDFYFQQ